MAPSRLDRQIRFLLEVDRLKGVRRRTLIIGGQRRENAAEHSWHLAIMALLLAEHAPDDLDEGHVIKLVLVHDLVEIDAGDTYAYDVAAAENRAEREAQAARRIFGLLPEDQAGELQALWEEFEACVTPEARFANALDRLMPILHNYHTGGISWQQHDVRRVQVEARCTVIEECSPVLGALAKETIQRAVAKGYLSAQPP